MHFQVLFNRRNGKSVDAYFHLIWGDFWKEIITILKWPQSLLFLLLLLLICNWTLSCRGINIPGLFKFHEQQMCGIYVNNLFHFAVKSRARSSDNCLALLHIINSFIQRHVKRLLQYFWCRFFSPLSSQSPRLFLHSDFSWSFLSSFECIFQFFHTFSRSSTLSTSSIPTIYLNIHHFIVP